MENTCQRYPGCKLPLPYPSVPHQKPDTHTAHQLMPLLLGRNGALRRYLTLSYVAAAQAQTAPFFSQTLECFAQTEQLHVSLLLELIGQAGNVSRRTAVCAAPFPPLTSTTPVKQIEALRTLAIAARKQYEKEAAKYTVSNLQLSQLLSRLAQDEQHHAACLYHLPNRMG